MSFVRSQRTVTLVKTFSDHKGNNNLRPNDRMTNLFPFIFCWHSTKQCLNESYTNLDMR